MTFPLIDLSLSRQLLLECELLFTINKFLLDTFWKIKDYMVVQESNQGRCWGKPSKPFGLGNPPAWGDQIKKKKKKTVSIHNNKKNISLRQQSLDQTCGK